MPESPGAPLPDPAQWLKLINTQAKLAQKVTIQWLAVYSQFVNSCFAILIEATGGDENGDGNGEPPTP